MMKHMAGDQGQENRDKPRPLPHAEEGVSRSLVPEVAKRMAEELFHREEELARLLAETPKVFDVDNIMQKKVFIEHDNFGQRISSFEEPIAAYCIGDGSVVFAEHFEDYPNDFPARLGIKTRYRLDIGLHTDETTRPQMEELAQKDPKARNYPQTIYLVGENAKGEYVFGKVCGIPRSIIDPRVDVGNPVLIKKYVISEFAPGDVEIMGASIKLITDKLRPI